jgi:hypothetical protein
MLQKLRSNHLWLCVTCNLNEQNFSVKPVSTFVKHFMQLVSSVCDSPKYAMKKYGMEVKLYPFWTSAVGRGEWSVSCTVYFTAKARACEDVAGITLYLANDQCLIYSQTFLLLLNCEIIFSLFNYYF